MPTVIGSAPGALARFTAGALLANAVPHSVKGLTGQRFPTPFADPPGVGPSSPAENIAWGAINLTAAVVLLRNGIHSRSQGLTVLAGGVVAGFGIARYFGALDLETGTRPPRNAVPE